MNPATVEQPAPGAKAPAKAEWQLRMWMGCDFFAWVRLVVRNRCALSLSRLCYFFSISTVAFFHTLLRWLQQARYGRRIARTPIREAPIFVIGHWRTGTTFLHELLALDSRHTFPTSSECLDPTHFLLTEGVSTRLLRFLLPSRRPMDNMAVGWGRPQEDEFALCMLGQPSPYLTIAFPNHPPAYPEYLDLEDVPPRALASWKHTFLTFLRALTFKKPGRLVLKSPPHTCRIKVLRELFPEARFVHIVRDPYAVFPSTVHMLKSLYRMHGLQRPTYEGLEEYVFTTFNRMYEKLEETRGLVEAQRFHELKYEDLVRDPIGEMRRLYEGLELGGFKEYLPRLEAYLATSKGYETNRYELTPEQHAEIARRWGWVIQRYGYE
ncbi:MAG: sulfotransferase family protein [Egibacteraceae bacterium]